MEKQWLGGKARQLATVWSLCGLLLSGIAINVAEGAPSSTSTVPLMQHKQGIPPALQPWRDWVRYQEAFRDCPLLVGTQGNAADDFLCAWPGRLALEVGDKGATFSQSWQVSAESWVPLPGDARYWPQEVRVNGMPQPVLTDEGRPALLLKAGHYVISGRLLWQDRPQALTVSAMSGLVALSIDGKMIAPVQREEDRLTLGRSTLAAHEESDSLEMQVYRKLTDDIPARLTTQIQLKVSGKAREITVAPALPEAFVAMALETPWPAKLDPEGRLQVQVQPGQAVLTLTARADKSLHELRTRVPGPLTQEIWSYEAIPALRVTAIAAAGEGQTALAVDPRQSGVPAAWQDLPAFAMDMASALVIEERSRGVAADENNRLVLNRTLWLDFSGDGYFARDTLQGKMQHGWRLDVAAPYTLARAAGNDPGEEALLITQGADTTLTGVEWRNPRVALKASLRMTAGRSSALPVTGWQQTFDQINTTLHLPYGYKLLAAPGADTASDSWIARWTILDIFFVAFITLLAWRLLGVAGGLVTAGYLVLALLEPDAPLWTLAVVLALALVRRVLPDGRLGNAVRMAYVLALLAFGMTAILFVPGEIRSALYPQLERADNVGRGAFLGGQFMVADEAARYEAETMMTQARAPEPMQMEVPSLPSPSSVLHKAAGDRLAVSAAGTTKDKIYSRYSQSTVVQTGAGEPNWALGQQYHLHWSGPVSAAQQVRFIISPPWLTRTLRLVLVALLGVIVWRVLRRACPRGFSSKPPEHHASAASSVVANGTVAIAIGLLLAGGLLMQPSPGFAQDNALVFPSEKLLKELQKRINEPPRCAPDCANLARAEIIVRGNMLRVLMEAHAGYDVALPLPGVENNLTLQRARLDGQLLDSALQHQRTGFMALTRGVHHIELEYTIQGGNTSLHFSLLPGRVLFTGQGWRADGIDEERLINETVRFSRYNENAAATTALSGALAENTQQFPPYVRVMRELHFDLDWTIGTEVMRIAPREGGLTVNIPLLPGEHVTTPGIKVQGNDAVASIGHSESSSHWQGRLDKVETLQLTAPPLVERSEVWRVVVGPSWHLKWGGVPVVLPDNDGEQIFEFHPLPGETLTLTLTPPPVVEGTVRAIDAVTVNGEIGARAAQYTLSFTLRASRGGEHTITLPPESVEVLSVTRNQENLNLRPADGKLTLPVSPGTQSFAVTLRKEREIGMVTRSPAFDLGLPAANINLKMNLSEQRWLLAAKGPPVGPAVLYWGELLVALVMAFLLARSRRTELRLHHWFLLALGFSTFSWAALALIVFWLFALDWRGRAHSLEHWSAWRFNTLQVGLALLSLAALGCLIAVIPVGLLSTPDMSITGHGSYGNQLSWFVDQSANVLPTVTALSLPMWLYRIAMLAWALWLAQALIGWLRRGLAAWTQGGYWRKR